ncbi:MAG: DUF485 domain-containing protein [Alphaproteobacteria bacterium]
MSSSSELHKLSAQRWRFALLLSVCMVADYFGFILLVAFNKPLLGTLLMPGLSLGILLGANVIVLAWVFTLVYVKWANGFYDRRIAELRR